MNDQILARLRAWIGSSGISTGDRLPPERDFCTALGVSRAELRKALLVLEANGSLVRKVGRGTFLTKKPEPRRSVNAAKTVSELAERTGPQEAMIARIAIEPELARMAAIGASPLQLRKLRLMETKMRKAPSWRVYEELDLEFHDLIAESASNSLLHDLHKILNGVRVVVVWQRLSTPQGAPPPPDYHSFVEHDAIVTALEKRSGSEAFEAMKAHLQSTLSMLTTD